MRHLNKPRGTLQQFITFPLVLFLCSISIQMDEWKFGDRDKPSQIQYNAFNIPLRFEENQGQIASSVKYFCRGGKAVVGLSEKEIQLAVGKRSVKMEFVGASNEVSLYGVNKLPGKVNYYLGNDSQRWKTKVPSYRRVKYENIYS